MSGTGLSRWKLLSPFLFLRLEYEERWRYNAVAFVVSAAVTAGYMLSPIKPELIGPSGVFEDVKLFVTILFPFFVGALVAIATYQRKELDDYPTGGQVTLARRGEAVKYLSRRQFVCFIFGYCAALSVFIFLMVLAGKVARPLVWAICPDAVGYVKPVAVFILSVSFTHMLIVTFWGLYYLSDRLHSGESRREETGER